MLLVTKENMINIKDIVKDNMATFMHYKEGKLWYKVDSTIPLVPGSNVANHKDICMFPVDITDTDDIGSTTFEIYYKAITMMRYIRKSIENDTIVYLQPEHYKEEN